MGILHFLHHSYEALCQESPAGDKASQRGLARLVHYYENKISRLVSSLQKQKEQSEEAMQNMAAAIISLQAEKEMLLQESRQYCRQVEYYKAENTKAYAQLDWLRRQVFGTKSEHSSGLDMDGQLALIFGAGQETEPIIAEETTTEEGGKEVKIDSFTRKTGKKKEKKLTFEEMIEGLPINEVKIPADAAQRVCPECGEEMQHLGWNKVRTEITVVPESYVATVYYSESLICNRCKEDDLAVITEVDNTPPALIPHSLASPSFVAHVAMLKYKLYVPNYRLEDYLRMRHVLISREAMANQLIYVAEHYLVAMYEWLHRELKKRPIVNADETPAKVIDLKPLATIVGEDGMPLPPGMQKQLQEALDKETKEGEEGKKRKNCYMWLYSSRYGTDMPIILYDYQPSREGACCEIFLGGDYAGYIIIDGYTGYNGLKGAIHCICFAHFRRYWFEAIKVKTGKLDESDPAVHGFMFANEIFRIERELAGLSPEARYKERLGKEKQLWDAFWAWQDGIDASGGSPLQKALTYARNHREDLCNYMLDGRLPITNAYAELQAKSYATGRKNFLFHYSAPGARSAAIIMSLIETAKANGLDPEKYLAVLLECREEYLGHPEKMAGFAPWSARMQESCGIGGNRGGSGAA